MTGWHGSGCAEDVLYLVIEDVSAESLHYRALCANATKCASSAGVPQSRGERNPDGGPDHAPRGTPVQFYI
jgi:hypothetical protein